MNHLRPAILRQACRAPCLSSARTDAFYQARRSFHNAARRTSQAHPPLHREGPFANRTSWRASSTNSGPSSSSSGTPPPGSRSHFKSRQEVYAARNRSLLMYTSAVIVLGVGVTYAAVPLYRMFCAATGFAGTPKVGMGKFEADRLVPVENAKRIKVHFNADTSDALPWSFTPEQKFVSVLPGETSLAFYKAKNKSDKDIIGIATYNVTPDRIAPYFAKVECFCFEEQKLLAGEEVDMPLLFFIDRDVLDDPQCRNLDDIVLSYTFFRARRNAQGHLEPDAPEDVVQASQGFAGYELAPKVEDRKKDV
ncbi:cytochrome c oxidase assembly protein CtaG/Cox11-domain-containing protein [Earliella scabrosa]|nr:cytochrome c oxidase assembly protein CtaG/Cox11-domain-containing protein [Earliella scabrosa]